VPESVPGRGPTPVRQHPTATKFVRKNRPEIRRFRPVLRALVTLANRRLQPLGHFTATRSLSIYDITTYANAIVPVIVPEIVPACSRNRARTTGDGTVRPVTRTQRFFRRQAIPQSAPRQRFPGTSVHFRDEASLCDQDARQEHPADMRRGEFVLVEHSPNRGEESRQLAGERGVVPGGAPANIRSFSPTR
jgi:hypothetical protein